MTYPPTPGGQEPYGYGSPPHDPQYGQPQQPVYGSQPFEQPAYQQPTYEQAAYAQPQYGQQQFGQQPYPQQAYPGYAQGNYGPGYQAQPSGTTGVIAAILAFLGGLHMLVVVIVGLVFLIAGGANSSELTGGGTAALMAIGVIALLFGGVNLVLLVWGGVDLLRRRMRGRTMVLIASGLVIAMMLINLIITFAVGGSAPGQLLGGGIAGIFLLIFPVATAILAFVPSTVEWIKAKPEQPGYDQFVAQQYPAQQQYPGQY